jgi:hypothetical protein
VLEKLLHFCSLVRSALSLCNLIRIGLIRLAPWDDVDHAAGPPVNAPANPEEATMAQLYRIFGAGMSPYPVKVRAIFAIKASRINGGRLPWGIAGIDDQFLMP